MATLKDRLSFRCSSRLKEKLAEAAKRSQLSISDQARISLEKLYEVEQENSVWLPPMLRQEEPGSKRPQQRKKEKALVG